MMINVKKQYSKFKRSTCVILFSLVTLASCTKTPIAPVVERTVDKIPEFDFYYVASGDTLYSIAFLENRDYKDLAKWNDIAPPYDLIRGQKIYINEPEDFHQRNVVKAPPDPVFVPTQPIVTEPTTFDNQTNENLAAANITGKTVFDNSWLWPIEAGYKEHIKSNQNNGLDIVGQLSSPVLASAPGTVVYAGNGLKGYGNMLIIKHNDQYLSAYAHNDVLLVGENDKVFQSQPIAKLGSTDSASTKLHFEIRKDGEPVQPLTLLPSR